MQVAFDALRGPFPKLGDALRVLRQLVMERLVVLDCEQQLPLEGVTRAMTELAEFALDEAYHEACAQLQAQYGAPFTAQGLPAVFWVVGMGKLGARELNVSSDIDLIYVYDEDGETQGRADGGGRISTHEYHTRLVKQIYTLVGDTTEHGFVFRMDLALRPNGNSGPSVVSLSALEEYFLVQGREWERFAWLKSRVVAPLASQPHANALRDVVLPFVFRRYLDYSVFEALRGLHRQIRDHAARRNAGRPQRANDVKLSRGGIREIEFTVQLLQVVRGGQFPELRTRPTQEALARVARANLMPSATAQALSRAYVFLRQVEHRIQYLDDQQTHALPSQDADLHWVALTLGYADCCDFLSELDTHRELVAQEFDRLLGQEPAPPSLRAHGGGGCRSGGGVGAFGAWPARAHRPLARPPAGARFARRRAPAPAQAGATDPVLGRGGARHRRGCRALERLGRAFVAARKLPCLAGGATACARAVAALAGCCALAGALPFATPRGDRRTGQPSLAQRTLCGARLRSGAGVAAHRFAVGRSGR
jgi:glutamate-ammonia-ligase adenylyltransferase